MTRAEWIQQYVLDACRQKEYDDETFADANHVADALEKSGAAPWDDVPQVDPAITIDIALAQRTVKAAVRTEREACAKVCDEYIQSVVMLAGPDDVNEGNAVARHVAAGLAFAIRARQ